MLRRSLVPALLISLGVWTGQVVAQETTPTAEQPTASSVVRESQPGGQEFNSEQPAVPLLVPIQIPTPEAAPIPKPSTPVAPVAPPAAPPSKPVIREAPRVGVPRYPTAQTVVPMKYFVPAKHDEPTDDALAALRSRYAEIMARRASLMTAEELTRSIEETQQQLDERLAREALGNVEEALRKIVADFAETAAGRDAERVLQALTTQQATIQQGAIRVSPSPVRR